MNTYISLSENKTLEVQLEFWDSDETIFDFNFKWSRRTDHAGLYLDISIWRFSFYFSICDNRHWDYEKKSWMTYDESKEEEKIWGCLKENYKGADQGTLGEDD